MNLYLCAILQISCVYKLFVTISKGIRFNKTALKKKKNWIYCAVYLKMKYLKKQVDDELSGLTTNFGGPDYWTGG